MQSRSRSLTPSGKPGNKPKTTALVMPELDLLLLGASKVGKTTMMQAFAKNEEQTLESHPFHA